VTAIDGETGLVTARDTATGQVFRFKAGNNAMLESLHIGQRISADFGASIVSVKPGVACCGIVAAAPLDPPNGQPAAAHTQAANRLEPPNGQKATTSANAPSPCCGIHAYEVDGVEVALMSVERTNPNEITVRWQYKNTTNEPRKLGESFGGMGSSEAFSLVWDAYLVDPIGRVKYPILKDTTGVPVGSRHGGDKVVTLAGNRTTSSWAKFEVPASVKKLTVNLPGTEPFENVVVTGTGQ